MKAKLLYYNAVLLLAALILSQCSNPKDIYEDPPWLGGTNIETLEKAGNYNTFLALMDKAEYRISIENQLFTLFAPSDSAFEEYFKTQDGISSVEDMSIQQSEELFAQHILINPRSRDQLIYEYAWGELQDPRGEYGALFHRKETYSVPLDYAEEVKYFEEFKDQTLKIYRGRTLIPLWTVEFFEDYFGDPEGSDYLKLYPGSKYTGTQWHDAAVVGEPGRTSSGFIYYIDRVVAPIPTIDLYMMRNQEKFGLYYDLLQRFAIYRYPQVNEQLERRYQKAYDTQISNVANQEGPDPGNPQNMLYMFTAFIPTNEALQDYLDNTVLKFYESIDSVPELYLVYLLQSHLLNSLSLPSKMENNFKNYYGDDIDIDLDNDIATIHVCSNGPIFTMNRVIAPNAFTCVPGPVFFNNNYTTFLYALQYSELLTTLTRSNINVTLFAADNAKMEDYGIRQNELDGAVILQKRLLDGTWANMTQVDIEYFIEDFIHVGPETEYSGEGFLKMASDNYVYYNNEKFSAGGNQNIGEEGNVVEIIPSEINGNLIYLDKAIKKPYNVAEYVLNDPDLSSFKDLLIESALIDSAQIRWEKPGIQKPRVSFINELLQWTVLAPTNDAIAAAEIAGLIPDPDANDGMDLRKFLLYHFVRGKTVFDDGKLSGAFPTNRDTIVGTDLEYLTLEFDNSPGNLTIQDLSGQVITVDHSDANKLIEFGVLHKINSVLKIEP